MSDLDKPLEGEKKTMLEVTNASKVKRQTLILLLSSNHGTLLLWDTYTIHLLVAP